jgi:hypothetical protein
MFCKLGTVVIEDYQRGLPLCFLDLAFTLGLEYHDTGSSPGRTPGGQRRGGKYKSPWKFVEIIGQKLGVSPTFDAKQEGHLFGFSEGPKPEKGQASG